MNNFWCEVNLNSITNNINIIKRRTYKKLCAVVKCNAYGLGIEVISNFLDDKVDGFAVNNVQEAHRVNSDKPILILLPNIEEEDFENARDNFIFTVDNAGMLEKFKDKPCRVHILLNTGMNRFGINPDKIDALIDKINKSYSNITIDGLYTHLNNTNNRKYTMRQIAIFKAIAEKYSSFIPNVHIYSSKGFLDYDTTDFDNWIRIGSLLYGYGGAREGFKQIFTYKARPIYISQIEKNEFIGYGDWKTKTKTKFAILEIGEMQGFNCRLTRWQGFFYNIALSIYRYFRRNNLIFYKGHWLKILGNTCMSYTTVSLNDINDKSNNLIFDVKLSSVMADSSVEIKYV